LAAVNDELVAPDEPICHEEHRGLRKADDAIARCGRVTTWPR
jgi:hypothetical protein